MNTKNSETNESNKFHYYLSDKLNLKDPSKNIVLVSLSIFYTWRNINLHITTTNLKYLLQRGLMSLIYLMDHILHQTLNTILSTLLKTRTLQQIIHPYKSTPTKSNIALYSILRQAKN